MSAITMKLKQVIELTNGDIGLYHYPIFDEKHRAKLNQKIIDNYLNREIAHETIDIFQLAMRNRMNLRMPYFNQLYQSELRKIDPFITIDMITESDTANAQDSEGTSTSNTESEGTASGRVIVSEFPQTQLSENEDYATNGTDSTNTNAATAKADEENSSKLAGTSSGKSVSKGFQGNQADMLMAYRATFMNIDEMVVLDLEELFMFVLDNPEPYFEQGPFTMYSNILF